MDNQDGGVRASNEVVTIQALYKARSSFGRVGNIVGLISIMSNNNIPLSFPKFSISPHFLVLWVLSVVSRKFLVSLFCHIACLFAKQDFRT